MEEKKEDDEAEVQSSGQDNMMKQFKKTYWEDTCPTPLPDLPGAIKVFGPSRPDHRLVGLSEYQDHIGKNGYNQLMKREDDLGTQKKDEGSGTYSTQKKEERRPCGRTQYLEF
ncbi:uncharacterized protein LOC124162937 isoform X2 [Ischnura elegans]|nr:uncharacterized protein LOC124162937 isoform X2 [Ischnura elegans]